MAYTVKQLAEISGVTVRTLHHYDAINLLKPARYGENNYRYYEEEQALQLQQILFFRELGFSLKEIAKVLSSGSFDRLHALNAHKKALAERVEHLQRLILTVDKTIARLKGEKIMSDKNLYEGLDPQKRAEQKEKLLAYYGECARPTIEESMERTKDWKKSDYDRVKREEKEINERLVICLQNGLPADHPDTQAIVEQHYQFIYQFYTPNKEMYLGLGKMYVTNPDFRAHYDAFHFELAEYLAKAIEVYVEQL